MNALPFAKLDDAQLYYEVDGKGDELLLIHGWNSFLSMWQYVRPIARRAFHVILPETRGHGRSTTLNEPASMKLFAQDLVSLLDQLNVDRCIVGGHSMGGMIAQQLAVIAPERVRALILICTTPKLDMDVLMTIVKKGQLVFGLPPKEAVEKRLELEFYDSEIVLKRPGVRELLLQDEEQKQDHMVSHGFAAHAILRFNFEDKLKDIRAPTLVIQGSHDPFFPVPVGEFFRDRIPNAILEIIDKTSHSIQLEQPEALVQSIIEFAQTL